MTTPIETMFTNAMDLYAAVPAYVKKTMDFMNHSTEIKIAQTPYDIVYTEDRVTLKHYLPKGKPVLESPLLINYALINKETMLDLQPGRSVVENLLNAGIELYVIDWGYPTRKDNYQTIDDHVNGYLNNIVNFVCDAHRTERINLMGICMGGTFSVMYAALYPEKIKNLITTVSPTSFDTDEGLLHVWLKHVNLDNVVDMFGNMPGDMMNFGFLLLNPARLTIDKYKGFIENMDDKAFVENFVRMEKWIFDSPDVPGETFRQFVRDCYQRNLLIQNEMVIGDKRIDLKNITMPLLNIYGKHDHLVPPGACNQITSKVGGNDTEDVCLETGHIGIYVSSKAQHAFAPKIAQWLIKRDGRKQEDARDVTHN